MYVNKILMSSETSLVCSYRNISYS